MTIPGHQEPNDFPYFLFELISIMRFNQLDRITELEVGRHLRAIKCVTLSEQHLHDHFPLFPVMPGVLMLEALYQASAWLIRASEDFKHSMVTLHETRNIKFQDFVAPGDQLDVFVEIAKHDDEFTQLKVLGTIGGKTAVNGRLILRRFQLEEKFGEDHATDQNVRHGHQKIFKLLTAGLKKLTTTTS